MRTLKYVEFIEGYVARIKECERQKQEVKTEVEVDTLNTHIELHIECLKTAREAYSQAIANEAWRRR